MISLDENAFEEMRLSSGEVLFKQGSRCNFSYILNQGHVICFSLSNDNRVIPVFSVKNNGLIGEDAIFSEDGKHKYYAVALKDSQLTKLPRKDILTYINSAGDWIKKILFDLAEKVTNTNALISEHKILSERLNAGETLSLQEEKLLLKAIR